jgi:AcrR family transcriptional regulator
MAPRRYEMGARADAVAETKTRIVAAAMDLHAKRGIQATRWEEIAEQAGVSVATMYRHFPSLKELVPACARTVFDLIAPLTVEQAMAKYARLDDPGERLAFLVHANVHCYGRGEDWLHAAYRERDFIPELDSALRIIQDSCRALALAAAKRRLGKVEEATLFTLLDFPFYKSLRSAGLDPRAAEKVLTQLVVEAEESSRRKKTP